MNVDEITRHWLTECYNEPIPEGQEERFGLVGKFLKYENLEAMEAANMDLVAKSFPHLAIATLPIPKRKRIFCHVMNFGG